MLALEAMPTYQTQNTKHPTQGATSAGDLGFENGTGRAVVAAGGSRPNRPIAIGRYGGGRLEDKRVLSVGR